MSYSNQAVEQIRASMSLKLKYRTYPTLGLFAVFAGTILAVFLVPDEPNPAGALRASAIVMTIGLLAAPAVSIVRQPVSLFRAENIIMLGLVYWILLDNLQGVYPMSKVGSYGITRTFIAIGVFAAGSWLAAMQKPWPLPRSIVRITRSDVKSTMLFNVIIIGFMLFMLRYLVPCKFDPSRLMEGLLASRFAAPWNRGGVGGWSSFVDHFAYFGYLIPMLTVCLAHQRGWRHATTIMSVLFIIIVILFTAQEGNRRIIGVMFGASVLCWITLQNRFTPRVVAIGLISTMAMLWIMQLVLYARSVGFGKYFSDQKVVMNNSDDYLRVDDNFLRIAQIIEIVPQKYHYIREGMIVYALLRPVPRAFWPNKPMTPGIDLARSVGEQNVSLTCSVVGEWYMSFGWPAVLFGGWLHGSLARMFSQLLLIHGSIGRSLVYAIGTMIVVAGMRSMIELVLMSYILIAWMLISRLLQRPSSSDQFVIREASA